MNTVLPIVIILILGCCSSLLIQRRLSSKWKSALVGAGIATLVWGGGVYLLLWLTAPNELGPPLFAPVLFTFLTALASSAVVMSIVAAKERYANTNVGQANAGHA